MRTFEFIFTAKIDARNIKSATRKAQRIAKKIRKKKDLDVGAISGKPAKRSKKK